MKTTRIIETKYGYTGRDNGNMENKMETTIMGFRTWGFGFWVQNLT